MKLRLSENNHVIGQERETVFVLVYHSYAENNS